MNARTVTTATLFTVFAGVFNAYAVDSQLLGLMMPDAKLVAGVNVDQAKASPFGLFVLTQLQSNGSEMQQLITLTGFDPTRDVHEVLAATSSTGDSKQPTGIIVARGNFDVSNLTTLATGKGAVTESYNNVTIIEDPKKVAGVAFLSGTLVVAGDVANVKAAIDRPSSGQSLPGNVVTLVNQWSNSSDAWIISVPPAALSPSGALGGQAAGLLQQIQQASAGVKFGASVVGTAMVQADTAQNATNMANALQFLVNMAQMQSQKSPEIAALSQGFTVSATGNTIKLTLSLPQAQFEQLIKSEKKAALTAPQVVKR